MSFLHRYKSNVATLNSYFIDVRHYDNLSNRAYRYSRY